MTRPIGPATRAEVAEWQTRRSQTPLRATSFEFESRLRHHRWQQSRTRARRVARAGARRGAGARHRVCGICGGAGAERRPHPTTGVRRRREPHEPPGCPLQLQREARREATTEAATSTGPAIEVRVGASKVRYTMIRIHERCSDSARVSSLGSSLRRSSVVERSMPCAWSFLSNPTHRATCPIAAARFA